MAIMTYFVVEIIFIPTKYASKVFILFTSQKYQAYQLLETLWCSVGSNAERITELIGDGAGFEVGLVC
jgi:hypothetical protein